MSRRIWRAAVLLRLALLVASWPVLAYAGAADDAVDAVTTVGHIAGVAVKQADAPAAKALVRCGLDGTPMLDCARRLVIDGLSPQVQPVAHCMVLGIAINACASPEALRQMPIGSRALVRCISTRSAIGTCSELVAIDGQQRDLLRLIDKLRADGRHDDALAPTAMRHLVQLAEALRDGDWEKVARVGGPAVHRVALSKWLRPQA